jgi:diamine N-acetyltransferase
VNSSKIFLSKNSKRVLLKQLETADLEMLCNYFIHLSTETKNRFGPHNFDLENLQKLYQVPGEYFGYIALDDTQSKIIAYSVIKMGFLDHDSQRLRSYGLILNPFTDCTFAPSVADEWQSQGIGNALFHFILEHLKTAGIQRIILWGGVRSNNIKAVNYYLKNGFYQLGQFEYQGLNTDMILDIH